MAEMETVKTFIAYFGENGILYECFAWVKSEEHLFSLLSEKFHVNKDVVVFQETHLFPNDEVEKEGSPVPMLITQVYQKTDKTIKFVE